MLVCFNSPSVAFCSLSSAGGDHNHGHGGVVEVSEPKGEVEAALSASGKHEHSHEQLHAYIGVSLVLGFVFMLLVDQIGSSHMHSTEGRYLKRQQTQILKHPRYLFLRNEQYRSTMSMWRLNLWKWGLVTAVCH